ncbi:hypothetical protein B0H15DRAFT_832929 [Mycena belliarum]|uniref:Uncharacterized protein n=1 Tax=Mycena belliarum TaxID=1033014 RepID=A0AAD6XU56_9AGAR|nr:hypothetical protein B0H15DRAFT_832929 [Mycena belliae]
MRRGIRWSLGLHGSGGASRPPSMVAVDYPRPTPASALGTKAAARRSQASAAAAVSKPPCPWCIYLPPPAVCKSTAAAAVAYPATSTRANCVSPSHGPNMGRCFPYVDAISPNPVPAFDSTCCPAPGPPAQVSRNIRPPLAPDPHVPPAVYHANRCQVALGSLDVASCEGRGKRDWSGATPPAPFTQLRRPHCSAHGLPSESVAQEALHKVSQSRCGTDVHGDFVAASLSVVAFKFLCRNAARYGTTILAALSHSRSPILDPALQYCYPPSFYHPCHKSNNKDCRRLRPTIYLSALLRSTAYLCSAD